MNSTEHHHKSDLSRDVNATGILACAGTNRIRSIASCCVFVPSRPSIACLSPHLSPDGTQSTTTSNHIRQVEKHNATIIKSPTRFNVCLEPVQSKDVQALESFGLAILAPASLDVYLLGDDCHPSAQQMMLYHYPNTWDHLKARHGRPGVALCVPPNDKPWR